MNERIRELAKQAGIKEELVVMFKGDKRAYVLSKDDVEKFAELIVKECADIADEMNKIGCAYPGDAIVESMGLGTEEGAATWRAK